MAQKTPLSFQNLEVAFASKSNAELKKMYWIFGTLNNSFVSKLGMLLTQWAFALGLPVKGLMKKTMFGYFCGGETIPETIQACRHLSAHGVQSILDLSVEGKGDEKSFDWTRNEIFNTLEASAKTDFMPFGVVKLSGLGDWRLLNKIQSGESLRKEEHDAYQRIKERLDRLCGAAHDLNLKILIDAEESWFQDVIDELTYEAMEKYNRERCVVYNTFQFYRKDSLSRLKNAQEMAQLKGFLLGAKPVRGAYMEKERERAALLGYPDPIQPDKAATDRDFDAAIRFCVENHIHLVCATHNERSTERLVAWMEEFGVHPSDERVYFSQLYGMSDTISFNLAKSGFQVVKYVPYGPVEEVLPYLTRRAAENSSIAGQSSREFLLVKRELKRRREAKKQNIH